MGACSGKPKTAEFEGIVKLYPHGLQIESDKKLLGDEKVKAAGCEQTFCNSGDTNLQKLIIIDQSSQHDLPVEGIHIYVRDALVESKNKSLAETTPEQNHETRINEYCDTKQKHLVALGEPQLTPTTEETDNTLKFQEKACTQNCFPFSAGTDDIGVCKNVEIEKSQTRIESITPSHDAEVYDLKDVSELHTALIMSKSHDSEWTTLDFTTFSMNSSSEKKGSDTFFTDSRASNHPHPKVGEESVVGRSSDTDFSNSAHQSPTIQDQFQLQKVHFTSNMSNEVQWHLQNSTKPLPAAAVGNFQVGDGHGASPAFTNIGVNSQMARGSTPPMIPEDHDDTQVVLKKQGSSANFIDFSVIEQISCASQNEFTNITKQDYGSDQVCEVSKELMVARVHEESFAASQLPRMWAREALHVLERVEAMDGNKQDIITDMDQMLEKLASEFERQESLSSFSVVRVAE